MNKYYQKLFWLPALLLTSNSMLSQTKELTMQEAFRLTANGNRQLQIRVLENQKASEVVKEAKSFLLPSITANGSYNVYGERPVIYLRNESKLNDVKFGGRFAFDGNVTANYPLINETLKSNVRMAGIGEQMQNQETKKSEEDIALEVGQLYLTVLVYKEQKKLLEQSLLRNERALKDSRSLFLQGKNLKTDTLSNYISVQNLKAGISNLDNKINVLSARMKQLMAIEDSTTLIFTENLVKSTDEPALSSTSSNNATAFENRRDLKIQSLRIDLAKEQLQNARASFKPQLSAVAQYQVQSQSDNLEIWNFGLPRTSFAGLKLSVPIYSGKRSKYKSSQSQIAIQQNQLALTDLKNVIQTELISLSANLKEANSQLEIYKQNEDAAQINYTMMNDRYRYGLGSRLELTDAELALTKAKLDKLQSIYSIRLIELQLKKAMGTLQLK